MSYVGGQGTVQGADDKTKEKMTSFYSLSKVEDRVREVVSQ